MANTVGSSTRPPPSNSTFGLTVVLAQSSTADRAHLRSHSGPAASEVFLRSPNESRVHNGAFTLPDCYLGTVTAPSGCDRCHMHMWWSFGQFGAPPRGLFSVRETVSVLQMMIVRLRWLLQASVCGTGHSWASGCHIAQCHNLFVVQLCTNATNMGWRSAASSSPRQGDQVCRTGLTGPRCHLVVVAIETGRRWSDESMNFISDLASVRSRDAPQALQRQAFSAWRRRWTRMLAVSCCRAFSSSLISAGVALDGVDGITPDLAICLNREPRGWVLVWVH